MYRATDFYVGFAFRCEGCSKDVPGKFTLPICTYCFEPLEISIFSTAEEENIGKRAKEKLQMLLPGVTLADSTILFLAWGQALFCGGVCS